MAYKNKNKMDQSKNNKDKNVKRIKRQKLHKAYYSAANVLHQLNEKSGSINSLMNRFKGDKCIKMIYALAVKVLKNHQIINEILNKLPEYDLNEMNSYLIEILIAELLFGEKSFLKYRRKNEVSYVCDNRDQIVKEYKNLKKDKKQAMNNNKSLENNHQWIRYCRINYLKNTKQELIEKLQQLGFVYRSPVNEITSFETFKKFIQSLNVNEFIDDHHFDDLLVFNDDSTKKLIELYENGSIAMQDKSSLLAIEAMNLKENMKIMDACAAPGMKTSAIASRLMNKCTIYANDKDKQRVSDMKTLLTRNGVKFKLLTYDFTQIDPSKYQDLDVLLLDPSCSGSGINRRLEYNNNYDNQDQNDDNLDETTMKRCENLSKFQSSILQASLSFNAKRIIYCTCSKYQIENENVIEKFLEDNPEIPYDIIDPMPEWPHRGQGDYSFSRKCLRADYVNTMTNGFFCCVFQRRNDLHKKDDYQSENTKNDEELSSNNNNNNNEDENITKIKSKKKKLKKM